MHRNGEQDFPSIRTYSKPQLRKPKVQKDSSRGPYSSNSPTRETKWPQSTAIKPSSGIAL